MSDETEICSWDMYVYICKMIVRPFTVDLNLFFICFFLCFVNAIANDLCTNGVRVKGKIFTKKNRKFGKLIYITVLIISAFAYLLLRGLFRALRLVARKTISLFEIVTQENSISFFFLLEENSSFFCDKKYSRILFYWRKLNSFSSY